LASLVGSSIAGWRVELGPNITPSWPGELHPEPLTDPDLVGIEPRRAHLVINDEVTFSRAPLQARKVGFPDSGFDLGISPRGLPEMEQA